MSFLMAAEGSGAVHLPPVSPIIWAIFSVYVTVLLSFDLWLNRKPHVPSLKHTVLQVSFFVANGLGVALAVLLFTGLGADGAGQYLAAYLIEWSLSVDNIFVIALVMTFFAVPREYHHKVLFYGIMGAIVMRFVFITFGFGLIQLFSLTMVFFGALLIWSAWKLITSDDEDQDVESMLVYRWAKKLIRATDGYHGDKFFVRINGKRWATKLLLAVAVVEGVDVVFAIDSVPAVLAITDNWFIAFSSNIMAIMGLRSVYFLYAYIESKISRLNQGLAFILGFIGVKMIIANDTFMGWFGLEHGVHLPTFVSLGVVFGILVLSVVASLIWPKHDEVDITQLVKPDATATEVSDDLDDTVSDESVAEPQGIHGARSNQH